MTGVLGLGLDIGSTTVKAVLLDAGEIVHETYQRHNADIQTELTKVLDALAADFPGRQVRAAVTGSGGLSMSGLLELPFVQEVIAGTEAISRRHPDADVVIELGGEDAKITYLKPVPEQRMNGTCAGGTGAFIDQMATLLDTDAGGLDALAARHGSLYPIASRCGVFAKSDVQPLINEGAKSEDLAASIFQAVATQTVAGLACGRPIRGNVVFLGGPLYFLPQLRAAFERGLAGSAGSFTCPPRAQLYVALGAAQLATGTPVSLQEIADRVRTRRQLSIERPRMAPLFADPAARAEFTARHAAASVSRLDPGEASGACFLGVDAGSTTIKAVVIDDAGRIVFSHYSGNDGDPVGAATEIVRRARRALPGRAVIARSCVTGYGEGLLKAALHIDDGEIETMAHYRAAEYLSPGVTSVIDIGGQDMKYLRIADGVIESIAVNEACSSGCGSFLETFAETLGLDIAGFAKTALTSAGPVDLGSRCTVFMNSSVKQAQKEGATIGDISAGLSYAVVRNALYKVIKLRDVTQLGDRVVVQGGTFLNDAVLRAFELLTGREVVRPDIAGLMGAFGAALIARSRFTPGRPSRLLPPMALRTLTIESSMTTCKLCQNHCRCTVSTFNDGERHVSGNRCERGADPAKAKSSLPNLFDYKYKRLFSYRRLTAAEATRGDIGIPRALNMYENYPFWFTVLTRLKFRVIISGRSSHELFERGMESIASENVCYPAKLAHGHVASLLARGVKTIFQPSVVYEQRLVDGADNHFNCPVVAGYPEVLGKNVEELHADGVRYLNPYLNLADPAKLAQRLAEVFAADGVSLAEAGEAVAAGFAEDTAVKADVRAEGARALKRLRETGGKGVVLAGRPYHVDPEVHHGIPELITGLGLAVFTEDSVLDDDVLLERPLRVRDQWAYHSRLYAAAAAVAAREDLHLVQLTSFGCGLDAITSDQVAEILAAKQDIYTTLKIDEVSSLGAARIRMRSLIAAAGERAPAARADRSHAIAARSFTDRERAEHTIIAPQMSPIHFRLLQAALRSSGYRVDILEEVLGEDVETGLKYVHNDACYPAVMVAGQLVNAFVSGRYDPDRTSVLISQTGGMCRATNYTGLLRKGLREAGYDQVPVLAVSAGGLEDHPGFKLTARLFHRAVQAVVLGDLLQKLLLRVRPYEAVPGSATALYRHWDDAAQRLIAGRRLGYRKLIRDMVAAFDALRLRDEPRRPRVGVVGEILVKFHPGANNHVVDVIEAEGCEAVLPGLAEFFLADQPSTAWNYANLGTDKTARHVYRLVCGLIERYRGPARRALARSARFEPMGGIAHLADRAAEVLSLGNQAGEGWLLTGEILELIEGGVPNVVCVQPFACLPNHVTGKGMFRELRRRHPRANLVAIDYDPGASEVNQLNRLKLMLATAHSLHAEPRPVESRSGTADKR